MLHSPAFFMQFARRDWKLSPMTSVLWHSTCTHQLQMAQKLVHAQIPKRRFTKRPRTEKLASRFRKTVTVARPESATDPVFAAQTAHLRYISDESSGIRRLKAGTGFRYVNARGRRVRDPETVARIKSLVVPPAWTHVWISPIAEGHLQATGRDVRGRKQYRYHPRWREVRDESKYARMLAFGAALPRIRRHVRQDLKLPGLPRKKVLAIVVALLEETLIRIGNEEYTRTNGSYGLTTLRDQHAKIHGSTIDFHFRGKSGKMRSVSLTDKRLARLVRRCRDIPGHELFQYVDEKGAPHTIGSVDVNDYLREIAGAEFTAKDFRTWAGTMLAATTLVEIGPSDTARTGKKQTVAAVRVVAERLGNTVAVCRKCYIHPNVLESYLEGTLSKLFQVGPNTDRVIRGLRASEISLLSFLKQSSRHDDRRRPRSGRHPVSSHK
jgi:DNA topoisomerase I